MDSSVASLLILIALNVAFLILTLIFFSIYRKCRGDGQKIRLNEKNANDYYKVGLDEEDVYALLLDPSKSTIFCIILVFRNR